MLEHEGARSMWVFEKRKKKKLKIINGSLSLWCLKVPGKGLREKVSEVSTTVSLDRIR